MWSFGTIWSFSTNFSLGVGPGSDCLFGTGADRSFCPGADLCPGTDLSVGTGTGQFSSADITVGTSAVTSGTEGVFQEGFEPDGFGPLPFRTRRF